MGNAIDAFENTREGKIEVNVEEAGHYAKITVADNGKGIPKQIRDNLFTAFVTHGKSGGTGLGTAIVRSIIEAHDGSVELRDSTAGGLEVIISLPLRARLRSVS